MHQTKIRPVLCTLPLKYKSKQLLIRFNTVFNDLNFRVRCLIQLVKGLFFINEDNHFLSVLEKFPNCSDLFDILSKKRMTT